MFVCMLVHYFDKDDCSLKFVLISRKFKKKIRIKIRWIQRKITETSVFSILYLNKNEKKNCVKKGRYIFLPL